MIRPIRINIDETCSSSFTEISKVNLLFRRMNEAIRHEKEEYIKQKGIMLNESTLKKISRFLKRQGRVTERIYILDKYIDACKKIENFNYILASESSYAELKKISKVEMLHLISNIFNYIEDINSYFSKTLIKPKNDLIYFHPVKSKFEHIEYYLLELVNRHREPKKKVNIKSNFSVEVKKAFLELGLKSGDNVSASIIKKQYKEMAKKHHPDKGGCVNKMQKLNEAYAVAKSYFDNKSNSCC